MKSLTDLYTWKDENIDSTEFFEVQQWEISPLETEKQLEDFSQKYSLLSFSAQNSLSVDKNFTVFFDALTKKTSRLFGIKEPLVMHSKNFKFSQRNIFAKFFGFSVPKKKPFFSYSRNSSFFRFTPILGIVLILFSLLWLDKIFVENRVLSGYQKILNLQWSGKWLGATQENINNARFDFLLADLFFLPFSLFPFQDIENAKNAISWGKYLTKTLDRGLSMYHTTEQFINQKDIQDIYFTQLLQNIAPEFQEIETYLSFSLGHYEAIEGISDIRISSQLEKVKSSLKKALSSLSVVNKQYDSLLAFLGHNEKRNYLLVFQNADEIRPTWGFMGSMGVVEIFRGKIQKFEMRDVYSFEWDLKKSPYQRLPAPPGIDTLTDTFWLRDANYFINTRDSSENIRFFVENSGQDIDGIFYVNQNILLDFLKLTGGIYFEPVGRIIDENNFSEIMSLLVEAKLFKVGTLGTPKQILFDFVAVYQSLLLEKKQYFEYLKILVKHIKNRDLVIYSFHPRENDFLEGVGLSGKIDYTQTLDFSYPVFTSLSWNKSDRYVERVYKKEVTERADCSIETRFTLGQRHSFSLLQEKKILSDISDFQIQEKSTLFIQGKWKNVQFIRVMIPHEAQLEVWKDMTLVDYGVRKWIEFYTSIEPGERKNMSFSYVLPNPDCKPYSFALYKQAGIRKYELEMQTPESKEIFSWFETDFFYPSGG